MTLALCNCRDPPVTPCCGSCSTAPSSGLPLATLAADWVPRKLQKSEDGEHAASAFFHRARRVNLRDAEEDLGPAAPAPTGVPCSDFRTFKRPRFAPCARSQCPLWAPAPSISRLPDAAQWRGAGTLHRRARDALIGLQSAQGFWLFELEADCTIPAEYIMMMHFLDEIDVVLQEKITVYLRRPPGRAWRLAAVRRR